MSRFTGKADFCDLIENAKNVDDFYMFQDSHIYMNNAELKIDSKEDLYQYYPFLISSMSSNKINDSHTSYSINLTKEPYWDSRERESLAFYVREYLYIYKKWKKSKTSSNFIDWWKSNKKDKYYDEDTFIKISSILSDVRDIDNFYFLTKDKVSADLRQIVLEDIVDKYLYNIHLPEYQKQRNEFLKWYDTQKVEKSSQIINLIKFNYSQGI